ncbi:hypothetical protein [Lentzea flava]|uniref:Winged helix DNA-binding domain-containing protein n=1 Tax=Lentzea flava TaxID=103732 RepID=A0ABQ2VC64_9PSEU|nr:hypothetical protein [Lentzea flava]MCP2204030.1 hypothetical protein [Lentzea flava]GGU73861.1 hypothetical protein GCM10010178_76630 [Lentzea flava]
MTAGTETGMPEEQLTIRERAALLVLMAEARELTNAELRDLAGLTIDGDCRRRLNDLGLVASNLVGRAYVHDLTDQGALWCKAELSAPRPPRAGYLGGALYVVLAGVRRHLETDGRVLGEFFTPDLGRRIETSYRALATRPGGTVSLRALREHLDDVPADRLDLALTALAERPDVHLWAEADQKSLTDPDRQAALVLGGSPRHTLVIEAVR